MLAIMDASFGYLGEDGGNGHSGTTSAAACWPASASASWAPTAGQKSTLVKTIARTMAPLVGSITEGKGPVDRLLRPAGTRRAAPAGEPAGAHDPPGPELGPNSREPSQQDLRSYLGSFNFTGDMVKQAVGSMSGGEKARLVLAMIVWQRPNLLLLDEPTNHLDLATREALSMALNEFEGTVMLVSHDRALLRAVCDEFWMVGRGAVGPFDGDLDDYQRYLLDEAKRQRELAKTEAAAQQQQAAVERGPAHPGDRPFAKGGQGSGRWMPRSNASRTPRHASN